jgi:hypothetical protein
MIRILLCARLTEAVGTGRYDVETSAPTTVKAALAQLCSNTPMLRPYIWDDTAVPFPDVLVCVNSMSVKDPIGLSDVLHPTSVIHIFRSFGPRVGMAWSTDWRQRRLATLGAVGAV